MSEQTPKFKVGDRVVLGMPQPELDGQHGIVKDVHKAKVSGIICKVELPALGRTIDVWESKLELEAAK